MATAFEKYQASLIAAFESDDFEWFINQAKISAGREPPLHIVVDAFHKTRMMHSAVSEAKRRESQAWLADQGKHYENGLPIRKDDPLRSRA